MQNSTLQYSIIKELSVLPVIDPEKEIERRVRLLADYLLETSHEAYVLGISGGVDSALAGRLAQLACEQVTSNSSNKPARFYAVRLPYGSQSDADDADRALRFISPDKAIECNIKLPVDAMIKEGTLPLNVAGQGNSLDFCKGNLKARLRMSMQYFIAGLQNALVIGTDHAAEAVTGFFTKFGDGACDIAPLYGLNKRQVRLLARTLGAEQAIYDKVPTADLECNRPLLPDEVALSLSYDDIDDYLEGKTVRPAVAQRIEALYKKTQHKRAMPVVLASS